MPKLNSVITIITHLKGVVYFFVFFTSLSSTRSFKSLSPSSESWDKGKVTPHIKRLFFFFDFSQLPFFEFQIQCFCFYHLLVFFHCSKQNAFDKSSRIVRKKRRHHISKFSWHTFMARRISFMPAKKTSNALQCLLNEL